MNGECDEKVTKNVTDFVSWDSVFFFCYNKTKYGKNRE